MVVNQTTPPCHRHQAITGAIALAIVDRGKV